MLPVVRYAIVASRDNAEVAIPVADAHKFLQAQALLHWKSLPLAVRFTERGVAAAFDAALEDAVTAIHLASLRV